MSGGFGIGVDSAFFPILSSGEFVIRGGDKQVKPGWVQFIAEYVHDFSIGPAGIYGSFTDQFYFKQTIALFLVKLRNWERFYLFKNLTEDGVVAAVVYIVSLLNI